MPWKLRDLGLLRQVDAFDAGCVVPPRYMANWQDGDGDRNADAIASYSIQLADRVGKLLSPGKRLLTIGGDCSILLGNTLALRRRGRYGLVFFDAHSDFRHQHNFPPIGAAAGEDLAIVTGRGDSRLINIENLGPYVAADDVFVVGVLSNDEGLKEMGDGGISIITNVDFKKSDDVAERVLEKVEWSTDGFWIHLDFDVVDKSEMWAVDCPETTGLSFAKMKPLVKKLITSERCAGMEITIYDPDLDQEGVCVRKIMDFMSYVFSEA
jgi:arginase